MANINKKRIFFDCRDNPTEIEFDLVLSGEQVARKSLSWDLTKPRSWPQGPWIGDGGAALDTRIRLRLYGETSNHPSETSFEMHSNSLLQN